MIDYELRSGYLAADPEIRYTPNGAAVVNFRIMNSSSRWDENRNEWVKTSVQALNVSLWDQEFKNGDSMPWTQWAIANLHTGDHVAVYGQLVERKWQTKAGENRYATEFRAKTVFLSLKSLEDSNTPPAGPVSSPAPPAMDEPPF